MYFNIFVRCPCNIFGEESIFFITNESDNDNNDVLPLDREPLNIAKCDSSIPTAGCAQSQQWAACPAAGYRSQPADPLSGLSTPPIITHTCKHCKIQTHRLKLWLPQQQTFSNGSRTWPTNQWSINNVTTWLGDPRWNITIEFVMEKLGTVELLDGEKKYQRICLAISNGSSSSSFNIIIILILFTHNKNMCYY